MPSLQDQRRNINTAILHESCPQCGFGEAVCSARPDAAGGADVGQFKTCPQCGYCEEAAGGSLRLFKGHGVYVLQSGPGVVKAGVFPRPIPDHKVSSVRARFQELGPLVRYVTRWNEGENRLEVLLGSDR